MDIFINCLMSENHIFIVSVLVRNEQGNDPSSEIGCLKSQITSFDGHKRDRISVYFRNEF